MKSKVESFHRHYPTYRYEERDIVLDEFNNAQSLANAQNGILGHLIGILLGFTTIAIPLIFQLAEIGKVREVIQSNYILIGSTYSAISFIFLIYFTHLQKTITLNARKVIVLRQILGLDYGTSQLVLPQWRIEGATNPFAIKMFPGWFSLIALPFWILLILGNIVFYLLFSLSPIPWYFVTAVYSVLFALVFRRLLYGFHEGLSLSFIQFCSWCLNIRMVDDFEYVLYRAKLGVSELQRLKFELGNTKEVLIAIEDRRYYDHNGVDFIAIVRAIFVYFRILRKKTYLKSGASTIPMQLARTLFIVSQRKTFRRKILEVLLAFWLSTQFTKDEILNLYLASVRFESGVFGIAAASMHFFKKRMHVFTNEEAFFLVERVSNIHSRFSKSKVSAWRNQLSTKNAIVLNNRKLSSVYQKAVREGLLRKD